MVGSVWDGGETAGGEGDGEGGGGYGGVGLCVCVCACVCVCVCVSRESSWEGDELEMQEVYRLAKCRVASRVKLGNIGQNGHGCFEG